MKITKYYNSDLFKKIEFLPLLLLRITPAYGFYNPAVMKWNDIHAVGEWFGSMGIPAPLFMAYLTGVVEVSGVILLILGLGTRLITIPLMITMVVAIATVHWNNGFEAAENGFEIPLYYLIMLFSLLIIGPGKVSLDYLIKRRFL